MVSWRITAVSAGVVGTVSPMLGWRKRTWCGQKSVSLTRDLVFVSETPTCDLKMIMFKLFFLAVHLFFSHSRVPVP